MLPQELIRRKRDGASLKREDVKDFIAGLTSGAVSEGQVAAFAMAVFFRGMSREEAVGLTLAMRDSGTVLQWDLPGPVVDKHSSGGIGDNLSLMLAPMLAACGCYVPMISGRGLGHTGGTLDKLDSIPGYATQPGLDLFRKATREAGCAIIGQTADLAPADKRLYGIRDVTATVESVPLITASILSKKLAAGLGHLVLDVKMGSGAFMTRMADAEELAESLVDVANGAGLPTTALITDMSEPLAPCAGNALEVAHACEFLLGRRRRRARHGHHAGAGRRAAAQCRHRQRHGGSPRAARRDARLRQGRRAFRAHGRRRWAGPRASCRIMPSTSQPAPVIRPVHADEEGFVASIRTRELGLAVIELGGGRRVAADSDRPSRRACRSLLGKGARAGPGEHPCASSTPPTRRVSKGLRPWSKALTFRVIAPGESATVLARITG